MPQKIFKIYDGRNSFHQWDTGQKLIVLDDAITEVHFSNRDMTYAIAKPVYERNGQRLCNIPDTILQIPRNIIAYASVDGSTKQSVMFAVVKRQIPTGYVVDETERFYEINDRLEVLETVLADIEQNGTDGIIPDFLSTAEATAWARENNKTNVIVAIKMQDKWIAHMVEDDYSVTSICDLKGEMVAIHIMDGGNAAGV